MKRSLEDTEDILFDGSNEDIEALFEREDERVSYSLEGDDMVIRVGNEVSRFHGVHYVPNCVSVFGLSYSS